MKSRKNVFTRNVCTDKFSINRTVLFITNLLAIVVVNSLFLQTHFAVDSYSHIFLTQIWRIHMQTGRPIAALVVWFMEWLGFNDVLSQPLFAIILMVCIAISSYILTLLLFDASEKRSAQKLFIINISVLLTFLNVFYIDWFMFNEASVIIGVASLLTCLATFVVVKGSGWWKYPVSLLILFCAINIYQVFFEFFVIFSILAIVMKNANKLDKLTVLKCVLVLLIAFVAVIATMLTGALINKSMGVINPRSASLSIETIQVNIKNVISIQPRLLGSAFGMLPRYVPTVHFAILLICLIAAIISNHKKRVIDVVLWFVMLGGCYIIVFAPHYVAVDFWPAERTLIALFVFIAFVQVFVYNLAEKRWIKNIIIYTSILFLTINAIAIQEIAADQLLTNALDEQYSYAVIDAISDYEAETGEQVTKIACTVDTNPTYSYYGYVDTTVYDTNISAITVSWSAPFMINYYSGSRFEIINNVDPEVYETYFSGKNWDEFNAAEQVICIDDTAYIISY